MPHCEPALKTCLTRVFAYAAEFLGLQVKGTKEMTTIVAEGATQGVA